MQPVIPIAGRVKRPHAFVQATLFNLSPTHATLLSAGSAEPVELPFKYLLYALGGALPAPISLLTGNGSKKEGVGRLSLIRQKLDTIAAGRPDGAKQGRVLVIGGGALGIQFSTDIKSLFPQMEVTLLHSRERMMTSFNGELHDQGQSLRRPFARRQVSLTSPLPSPRRRRSRCPARSARHQADPRPAGDRPARGILRPLADAKSRHNDRRDGHSV